MSRFVEGKLSGWHRTPLTMAEVAASKRERERRDAEGGKHRFEQKMHHGHLAEDVFEWWLDEQGLAFERLGGKDYRPDFIVNGLGVEVKTRHVGDRMRLDYDVAVPLQDVERGCDLYVFACEEPAHHRMLLLGAAERWDYTRRARLVRDGETAYGTTWATDGLLLAAEGLYAPRTLARALAHG
jgi:hypothetical protein